MTHPSEILRQHQLAALKKFGQNFLLSNDSLKQIQIETLLSKEKPILEIGPGLGMVTSFLLEKKYNLHVCEIDKAFAKYLKENLQPNYKKNFISLIQADFLKVNVSLWQQKNIQQVVGNLPFYISTAILQKVVLEMPFVENFILGVQKEFAERACAGQGNSLAIFLNTAGTTRLLKKIKASSFYPKPTIDAYWFSWQRDKNFLYLPQMEKLLRAAFWGKRKSLKNSLSKNPFWNQKNIKKEDGQSKRWLEILEQKCDTPVLQKFLPLRADQLSVNDFKELLEFFLEQE